MANPQNIVKQNVDGAFFVDQTCISCSNCRDLAPQNFASAGDYFAVFNQPKTDSERAMSLDALVCCPVGAIGIQSENKGEYDIKKAIQLVPKEIANSKRKKSFILASTRPILMVAKAILLKVEVEIGWWTVPNLLVI